MHNVMKIIVAFYNRAAEIGNRERGATATEYALLVAFIALAIIVGVTAFGTALNNFFSNLGTRVGLL
jgi:pilus assembly protein Flp/PilA